MTVIHVPRPKVKLAMDTSRPVNSLLKVQIQHLHDAELKLPMGLQTDIYINAIKTEGEAGKYIRRVTEAIGDAHAAAEARRTRPALKAKRVIEIAAVADEQAEQKRARASRKKNSTGKRRRKT
jgi:hypothetical protein